MKHKVIVVTSAYGNDAVRELGGQAALLPIIAASGADGVEIRRELLRQGESLTELGQQIRRAQLGCVYSCPEPLVTEEGKVDLAGVAGWLAEARLLNAKLLKLSLGQMPATLALTELTALLENSPVQLVIENDQTPTGGTLAPLVRFFETVEAQGVPIAMAFDMANWHWQGEDNALAATQLGRFVSYIHVKASRQCDGRVRAVALDSAPDTWRPLLAKLPGGVPRGIESPLEGADLTEVTRGYVAQLQAPASLCA